MASRIDYSQNRKLYVGTTPELSVADGGVVVDNQLILGGTSSNYMLDVLSSASIGSRNVGSNTTNFENKLVVAGKNNYSDGTTWYGDYGQILLSSTSNMTGSARQFLITNALDNNKFAIIRSVDAGTNPVTNSTGTGVNSGTADFVINNTGNVGIGTTSPDYKFEVQGVISSADSGLQKATFANDGNDLVLTANADATNVTAKILFKSSGTGGGGVSEKMSIQGDGSVIIGSSALGGSKTLLMLSADNAVNYDIDFQQNGTTNHGRIRYTEGASDLEFYPITGVAANLTLKFAGNSYFSRGNVGIGDTTNNAKLGVSGGAVKIKNIVSSSPDTQLRRNINIASFTSGGSTATGKLVIETPAMTTGAMGKFKISGWQYDESWDLTVSGYLRIGVNRGWQQIGGAILTGNPPFDIDEVRLCYNSTTNIFYIILGSTTTFWDYYTSIVIDADSIYQDSIPTTGWDMEITTTDPSGLTSDVTLTNISEYGSSNAIIPGSVVIGSYGPYSGRLNVQEGDAEMIFSAASSARPWLRLKHNIAPADGDEIGLQDFNGFNDANQDTRYVILTAKAEDVTDGDEDGSLTIQTMKGGTATTTLIARSGKVAIGGTVSPSQALDVTGKIRATDDIQLDQTSPRIDFDNGAAGSLRFFSTSANATKMTIASGGEVTLNAYDTNNQVGDVTYLLGVRADGQIVKTQTGATTGTQVHTLAATSGSASWKKIGTFTANQGGQSIFIKIVSNNGYNATISQNFEVYIRFKTSNGSSTDGNGFAADSSFYTTGPSGSLGGGGVKWVGNAAGTAATSYALYVNVPAYSGNGGFYVAECSVGSWVNNMTNASDPGVASSTILIPQEQFRVGSTDFVVNGGGGSAYFANSDLGIGTQSPQSKLHIETGSAGTYNPNSNHDDVTIEGSGNIGLQLFSPNTSYQYIAFGDPDSVNVGYLRYYHTSNEMVLRTNGGDHLRIDSSGNVGIGGSTPSYLLDVRDGTSSGAIARFSAVNAHVIIESSTAGPAVLHFKPNTTGNKSGQFKVTTGEGYNFRWSNDAAGTSEVTYMTLDTSTTGGGDLTVKGDVIAYGAPSDERYKENIKPIESALDKVEKLQGVTFDWKESDSILDIKEDIGFIAQDVQKVVPELVRENEDGKLSLRYQGITPILLEAIKELKAEIEELKKQIK